MAYMAVNKKAKAYDNVREKIAIRFGSNVAKEIFSEYEENEDEKIRKGLIDFLKSPFVNENITDEKVTPWIAWLEKQCTKEPKKTSIWKHWKDGIAGNGTSKLIYLIKNGNDYSLSSCLGYECDYILLSDLDKLMLEEKHDGQNPTDKVESKFKVKYAGNEYNVFEIRNINGIKYYGIEDEPNHIDYIKADSCKKVDGYSIKENGSSYPTNPAVFAEQKPVDKKYTFNAIPRLLSMIQPTDRAKAYCQKLIDILIQEGYNADAKIVGNCLKQMNGEKIAMATMDKQEPSLPSNLDEAAEEYAWQKEEPLAEEERLSTCFNPRIDAFKVGAEWMAGQKPAEWIQWTGKNLKEVIDFTGKSARFDEWFKSWDEYEAYVHSHGDILKLFCADGSHYEVPVGAWIVKTPDGYNIPSRFRFVPKLAEWSEEHEKPLLEKFKQAVYDCAWEKVTCKKEGETKEEYAERWAEQLLILVRDWADDYIDSREDAIRRHSFNKGKQSIQKPVWSEEDVEILEIVTSVLQVNFEPEERFSGYEEYMNVDLINWLKSLKERMKGE